MQAIMLQNNFINLELQTFGTIEEQIEVFKSSKTEVRFFIQRDSQISNDQEFLLKPCSPNNRIGSRNDLIERGTSFEWREAALAGKNHSDCGRLSLEQNQFISWFWKN